MSLNPDAESFAELALDLHEVSTLDETVERILEFACKMFNCAYAGVIPVHDGSRVETVASNHEIVAHLDTIQLEAGEGPDIEIIADRPGVLICDIAEETRWPTWTAAVEDAGIRSMLGARLYTTRRVLGSLNLYALEVDGFDRVDVDVAHMLARHAAVALESARGTEHLLRAVDARNLIGRARGILMERFSIEADRAFRVLKRYSRDNNLKLNSVAQRLIDTGKLPS
ncbi:GAF and ANTAR domain-containing protein [Nocardioides sp. B-3]|uniref:GAF and ANTAR domain-containing protein n=1 Tax=Nocardioides sp. B-3 TaxID=2895565 RepID=UPI002152B3BF|nr:GAF and ANTAR domain-containing protein [Nocardioides sp. B-3]UUZ58084.1 GAF and ANTAR domain-containing protein [Nocardioides sp. B-3]